MYLRYVQCSFTCTQYNLEVHTVGGDIPAAQWTFIIILGRYIGIDMNDKTAGTEYI